jgi:DNA-binding transcriptional MerR regulator
MNARDSNADAGTAVTARQGAKLVGVLSSTIRKWERRGEITAVGNHRMTGELLYSLARLRILARGYHARQARRQGAP